MHNKEAKNANTFFYIVCAVTAVLLVSLLVYGKHEKKIKEQRTLSGSFENIAYEGQPRLGDPNAKITVAVFEDFKCTACSFWEANIFSRLKREYIDTGKVKLYFVNHAFLGPDSTTAALAGEALYAQNEDCFWSYYQSMFRNQGDERHVWATEEFILELAKKEIPQADVHALSVQMKSKDMSDKLASDEELVKSLGIDSTPTVLVNGVKMENGNNYNEIKHAVENAWKKGDMK